MKKIGSTQNSLVTTHSSIRSGSQPESPWRSFWKGALRLGICAAILTGSAPAFSQGTSRSTPVADAEVPFAPEFEWTRREMWHLPFDFTNFMGIFNNSFIEPGPKEAAGIADFKVALENACPDCKIEESDGKYAKIKNYKFTFPSGYWIKLTVDAWVVEVLARPSTVAELESFLPDLRLLFKAAKDAGFSTKNSLIPFMPLANHLNFGSRAAYRGNPREFVAVQTDYANNPALSLGIFGKDLFNAPPMSALEPSQRSAMELLVDQANAGRLEDVQGAAAYIVDRIYTASPFMKNDARRYQSAGLKRVPYMTEYADEPTEYRAMRMPEEPEAFVLMAKLENHRIKFVRSQVMNGQPIVYNNSNRVSYSDSELISRFHIYALEMGLNPLDFMPILSESLRRLSPDAFVRGQIEWFRPGFANEVRNYVELIATSAWVQKRFLKALSHPDAEHSPGAAMVLRAALQFAQERPGNEPLGQAMKHFFKAVDQLPVAARVPELNDYNPDAYSAFESAMETEGEKSRRSELARILAESVSKASLDKIAGGLSVIIKESAAALLTEETRDRMNQAAYETMSQIKTGGAVVAAAGMQTASVAKSLFGRFKNAAVAASQQMAESAKAASQQVADGAKAAKETSNGGALANPKETLATGFSALRNGLMRERMTCERLFSSSSAQ